MIENELIKDRKLNTHENLSVSSQINHEKTVKCWNCETIIMVKEDWKVVQCPTCDKVCKIPENKQLETKFKYNGYTNNFNVNMPYVYVILICPYCRTDNKVRSTSEHMVCFKCHNSLNVSKDNKSTGNNMQSHPKQIFEDKTLNNFVGNKLNGNISYTTPGSVPLSHPMQKSLRFSDLFFPDPMFYPGYYPIGNSYSPLYPQYDPILVEEQMRKKAQYDLFKYHIEKIKDRTNKELSPLRNRLLDIKRNLDIKDENINSTKNLMNQQGEYYENIKSRTPDLETGFEDKIKNIKDKLINNKKSKNQAILRNMIPNLYY